MDKPLILLSAFIANCFSFFLPTGSMAVEPPVLPKQILVFGGNGMLGSATVERLIPLEYKLVLVSRGSIYWDSAFTISPFVQHIACDRWRTLSECHDLTAYLDSVATIDVVIDFSAYQPQVLQEALDTMAGKIKLYIYISTDSVYEVCLKNHSDFTLETDALRPFSTEEQDMLNSRDPYGHHKLECEELLMDYRKMGKSPAFISLRLPDVVGPRDNTYRWWTYQLWMKLQPYLETVLAIPQSLALKPLSFVYVNDVADLIFNFVKNPIEEAFDEAFNLASTETPNLTDVLNDIKQELNLTDAKIEVTDNPQAMRLYPSVHLGPINISKAEKILNWKPSNWKTVVKETVAFYEEALNEPQFDRVRKNMIRKFQTHFTSKPSNVIRGLIDMYGLQLPRPRDEL